MNKIFELAGKKFYLFLFLKKEIFIFYLEQNLYYVRIPTNWEKFIYPRYQHAS